MITELLKSAFSGTIPFRMFSAILFILLVAWVIWGVLEAKKTKEAEDEKQNKPELLIIEDMVFTPGEKNNYNITVKNFGRSTATDIMLIVQYNNPKGIEFIKKLTELPSETKITFQVPMVPDFAMIPTHDDWPSERASFIEKFNNKETVVIVELQIKYSWSKKIYESRKYVLTHEVPNKITLW